MDKNIKKILKYSSVIIISLILIRLFTGIYEHDEFNEKYFFIKSYPTWKWYFYSPRGMSDLKLENMSREQKEEQLMYDKVIPARVFSF